LDRISHQKKRGFRLFFQIAFVALKNGYWLGFLKGKIYTGPLKAVCVPGLNCYSCPGALASCPIGALQSVLADRNFQFAFYVVGFLMITGALIGRLVCGWLCPFGLAQDLLYKIPFVRKIKKVRADRYLKAIKYIMLGLFVIILPMFVLDIVGQGTPWFCKWICPSGTLMAGWPLVSLNPQLTGAVGALYAWKNIILVALIVLSLMIYRPFCRYLCPLGAVYGLIQPVSLYRYRVDTAACTGCGECQKACKLDIAVCNTPNSPDCIRCGDCIRACPHNALSVEFIKSKYKRAWNERRG
jgi:ferredoxin-type protein NapH